MQSIAFQLPRNPVLRLLVLAAGAVVAAALVAFGMFVGLAVLAATAITVLARRWFRRKPRAAADPHIIDGDYTVVTRPHPALSHHDQV